VTLRQDIELLRSATSVDVADHDLLLSDEHERYRFYLAALSLAPSAREHELIAAVLRDPDKLMAESAVAAYVDRKASLLASPDAFAAWTAEWSGLARPFEFLTRRMREWELFKRVQHGDADGTASLPDASDWLQLKVAQEASSREALTRLAGAGRTKRIRNTARSRVGRAGRSREIPGPAGEGS
jgi:hypothetical protein